jgi:hypothetical protein
MVDVSHHWIDPPIVLVEVLVVDMGSNGHMMVDTIQVHKVKRVGQSKSGIVWIYRTLRAHSPTSTALHWLHLEPTHLLPLLFRARAVVDVVLKVAAHLSVVSV